MQQVEGTEDDVATLNRVLTPYKIHALHTYGSYTMFFGITQEIYNSRYSKDSYILGSMRSRTIRVGMITRYAVQED